MGGTGSGWGSVMTSPSGCGHGDASRVLCRVFPRTPKPCPRRRGAAACRGPLASRGRALRARHRARPRPRPQAPARCAPGTLSGDAASRHSTHPRRILRGRPATATPPATQHGGPPATPPGPGTPPGTATAASDQRPARVRLRSHGRRHGTRTRRTGQRHRPARERAPPRAARAPARGRRAAAPIGSRACGRPATRARCRRVAASPTAPTGRCRHGRRQAAGVPPIPRSPTAKTRGGSSRGDQAAARQPRAAGTACGLRAVSVPGTGADASEPSSTIRFAASTCTTRGTNARASASSTWA